MNGSKFVWMGPLKDIQENGHRAVIALKSNSETEPEGLVMDVTQDLVVLDDPDDPSQIVQFVLLDEIAAVSVEKEDD